ncbi:putative nucleotidyltransferase, ribonuclease H [Tanacetum coccineum]
MVLSGVKLSSRQLPVWESATQRPQTLCGKAFNETRVEVIQDLAILQASQELFDPIEAGSCLYLRNQWRHPNDTTTGFLDTTHIPNINTTERPPVTTTVFAATTPGNTSFAYRASTLIDLAPMISPAFVEANYEILESLLRDRRRQICNEDLQTKLEYFSEDYDEELEMEPRPEQTKEVTPPLRTRSPRVHRQRERQEKSPLMELRMIRGITSKGQGNPPRTTAGDREVETDHGHATNNCRQLRSQIEEAVRKDINAENRNGSLYDPWGRQIHTTQGIGTVFSTHKSKKIEGVKKVIETSPANTEGVLSCIDAEEKIIINGKYLEQTVNIKKQLPEHFKERLRNLLRTNADVFVWAHANMTGIPRTITVNGKPFNTKHKLNKYSHIKPIKQKRRSLGPNHSTSTRKEVEDITRVGILREAVHQTWVENLVTVKKSDGGWRMCVDFTDINKACPKDCYPLFEIDWKVEYFSGFHLKKRSLLLSKDALRFKNAGAMYQRLVDKVLNNQIRRNLEAYIDDMVIKSISEEDMLADIKETFQRFRSINMKLNPKQCSFCVEEGPFLGHLITKQGIRANPSRLAALSRFLSKGAKRPFPFFKVLKSYTDKKNIQWTQEAAAALQEMKKFMDTLPMLTTPIHGEVLMMYLTASTESINAALFARRGKRTSSYLLHKQSPTRSRAQLPYTGKTHTYIGTHSNKSAKIFSGTYDSSPNQLFYQTSTHKTRKVRTKEVERKTNTELEETKLSCEWKLYTYGASSSDGLGIGLMLIDPEDSQLLVNQVKGIYAAKQPAIKEYLQRTKETIRRFKSYKIEHIRRNQNKKAGALSKLALMTFEHLTKEVVVEVLARRSIEEKEVLQVETKEEESCMTPIHEYLLSGLLPKDPKESRKIRIKAPQYKLIKGSCGFNIESRSMVVRITKQGYYWPSMHKDVSRIIQDCEKCKEQSVVKKRAKIEAIVAGNAWPFSHWGVNILGPLSTAPRGLKFLVVAIEHSIKWIEAKPLTTVSARHVERFVWEYVACRFGVPQIISSNDDKHFKEGIFVDLCRGLKIT